METIYEVVREQVPPEARQVPRIGDYQRLDVERIDRTVAVEVARIATAGPQRNAEADAGVHYHACRSFRSGAARGLRLGILPLEKDPRIYRFLTPSSPSPQVSCACLSRYGSARATVRLR